MYFLTQRMNGSKVLFQEAKSSDFVVDEALCDNAFA